MRHGPRCCRRGCARARGLARECARDSRDAAVGRVKSRERERLGEQRDLPEIDGGLLRARERRGEHGEAIDAEAPYGAELCREAHAPVRDAPAAQYDELALLERDELGLALR